jgi:hypothetical protein
MEMNFEYIHRSYVCMYVDTYLHTYLSINQCLYAEYACIQTYIYQSIHSCVNGNSSFIHSFLLSQHVVPLEFKSLTLFSLKSCKLLALPQNMATFEKLTTLVLQDNRLEQLPEDLVDIMTLTSLGLLDVYVCMYVCMYVMYTYIVHV